MNVIQTCSGQCRDCYKCVRSCPLKAIRINQSQAEVITEECIHDGLCTSICPQKAKEVIDEWFLMQTWLQRKEEIIISLAPSYLGLKDEPNYLVSALYRSGVKRIEETAWVVPEISAHYWQAENLNPALTSACPALVRLVEVHYPSLVKHLVPIVSPMILHARSIRERYPQAKIVFIGPCSAKKVERQQFASDIDLVLTFKEVFRGLEQLGINYSTLRPIQPDITGSATARQFPMDSGWRKSWSGDSLRGKLWVVNGFTASIQFLDALQRNEVDGNWAELMICKGGCLGGAGWNDEDDVFVRQSRLMSRVLSHQSGTRPSWKPKEMQREFTPSPLTNAVPSEEEIRSALAASGKVFPKDELDCGACGYNTCRAKAAAVVVGKAELEMCIPFMRAKAESLSNVIIETTPNGIIVVDNDCNVISLNPAAETMFECQESMYKGGPLSKLMDPDNFFMAKDKAKLVVNSLTYKDFGLVTRQYVFPVEKQNIIIGIFSDITQELRQTEELSHLKTETLQKASEVIEKQMRVAQEIAGLLGETTAETKVLLTKLIRLIDQQDGTGDKKGVAL